MCYSGKCKYEQYFGDCGKPLGKALCRREAEEQATIVQQPLSGSADATPKVATQPSDNSKRCTKGLFNEW